MTLPCAVMCDLMQYQITLNQYAKRKRNHSGGRKTWGTGADNLSPLPCDSTSGMNRRQESVSECNHSQFPVTDQDTKTAD